MSGRWYDDGFEGEVDLADLVGHGVFDLRLTGKSGEEMFPDLKSGSVHA